MSNLKEPPLNFDTFFDDDEKNQRMKQILNDLYQNASFKDVELETVTPDKRSMVDGESKFAVVDGDVRKYHRIGNDLYYTTLTKTTTPIETSVLKVSVTSGITASTTQTQGQVPLTSTLNEISTVANGNDTVTLPDAVAGVIVMVIHNGANILKIFPSTGDDISKTGVDAWVTFSAGDSIIFGAYNDTDWDFIAQIL